MNASAIGRARDLATGSTATTLGAVVIVNFLRVASTVVLTRLLDASAFGIIGLISSVSFMLIMLSDVGLFAFVVRHPEGENRDFLDEVWTIRVLRSVALAVAMVAVAWPVAIFTRQPEMAPVLAVWSVTFLLEGLSSLAFATSVRRNQLKILAGYDVLIMVIQLAISIALAAIFRSFWALVASGIIIAAMKIGFSYVLFPDNARRWRFSRARVAELWKFSRMIASSSALGMIIAQADKLVFARIMPLATFGLYTIAWSLATAPMMLSAPYAERIIYPGVAADFRDGLDLRETFYRRRRKVIFLFSFLVGGFIGSAPLIVEILYDPRYRDVGTFMQILSISTLAAMFSSTSQQALLAVGRTAWPFYATATRATWLAIGCAVAFVLEKPIVLVWTVGLMEVPGMLVYWLGLHRIGVFDPRQEAPPLLLAGVGLAIGTLGAWSILTYVAPALAH